MFRMYRVFLFLLAALLVTGGTMLMQNSADAGDEGKPKVEQDEQPSDSNSNGRKIYA